MSQYVSFYIFIVSFKLVSAEILLLTSEIILTNHSEIAHSHLCIHSANRFALSFSLDNF